MSPKNHNKQDFLIVLLLAAGFFLAVGLRVLIGGSAVSSSFGAGLAFAIMLVGLSLAGKVTTKISGRVVVIGVLGTLLLVTVPLTERAMNMNNELPEGNYLGWSAVIICVAMAEEAFLRGSLFDAITKWQNTGTALVITAVLFALLHVPLYGWHVLPLDLVVGLWLGFIRVTAKSWVAAGITHTLTDLISWWLI